MCATIVACLCSAMLEFPPGVTRLLVQVGAFLEPALPPPDAPHVASVIVEPVGATRRALVDKCAEEEARRNASFCAARVVLLGAAISNASGVGTMHLYNWGGVASSLSTVTAAVARSRFGKPPHATEVMAWNRNGHRHMADDRRNREHVPVLSLAALLDALPASLPIERLLLDMQGHDLGAARSCVEGGQLMRVRTLRHECWGENAAPFYRGVDNGCAHWEALMPTLGFALRGRHVAWSDRHLNLREYDYTWQRAPRAHLSHSKRERRH